MGKEFNKDYVDRMIEKIRNLSNEKNLISNHNKAERDKLNETICDNNLKITELRIHINGLEEANRSLESLVENMDVNKLDIERKISDTVDTLLRG